MKKILLIIGLTALFSCSEDNNNENQNPSESNNTVILLENSSFNGNAVVTYKDGTIENSFFSNGILKINFNQNRERRVIRSLKIEADEPILLGRKEGDSIKLNYQNGVLQFREPILGYYPINSIDELKLIIKNQFSLSQFYFLQYDLDLMSYDWTPLGNDSGIFRGKFDGNNKEISNFFSSKGGLFGDARFSEISNVIIKSGNIEVIANSSGLNNSFGSIVNYGYKINNCKNYVNLKCYGNNLILGGISGSTYYSAVNNFTESKIENCINFGSIEIQTNTPNSSVGNLNIGGICGKAINLINCKNEGSKILLNNQNQYLDVFLGGLVGISSRGIQHCQNRAEIKIISNFQIFSNIGGIAGRIESINNMNSFCSNNGNFGNIEILTPPYNYDLTIVTAGISATMSNVNPCFNNYNFGNITGSSHASFGIHGAGRVQTINCFNTGDITGYQATGICSAGLGTSDTGAKVSNCYNTGTIRAKSIASGIALVAENVDHCYNIGKIYSENIDNTPNSSVLATGICFQSITSHNNNNFWKDHPDDSATISIGIHYNSDPNSPNAQVFSETNWPSNVNGWYIGSSVNSPWKTLGSWNNGNPIYPKLFYEN